MWIFVVYFLVSLKKLSTKQSICRRFETPWRSCDVTVEEEENATSSTEALLHVAKLTELAKVSMTYLIGKGSFSRCKPAGTHFVPKTSSRQRFQDVKDVNSEDVYKI